MTTRNHRNDGRVRFSGTHCTQGQPCVYPPYRTSRAGVRWGTLTGYRKATVEQRGAKNECAQRLLSFLSDFDVLSICCRVHSEIFALVIVDCKGQCDYVGAHCFSSSKKFSFICHRNVGDLTVKKNSCGCVPLNREAVFLRL